MSWTKEDMAEVIADLEIRDGFYINLGIGMPTLISNYVAEGIEVVLHSENGMLGIGPFPKLGEADADLINAGKQTISELKFSSYFDSGLSFDMIRGGHIDVTVLGAFQVSERGDIANWTIPGKIIKGMGGAMDLVNGAKRVVVMMEHSSKDGMAKLVKECSYPLTGIKCVDRIVTNLGVFDVTANGLSIFKLAAGVSKEQVLSCTEARIIG